MPDRATLHSILEGDHPRWGFPCALFSNGVIIVACVTYALETLPDLSPSQILLLDRIEVLVIAIFGIEYMLRLYAAPVRLRYAFSFWGIIDLMAFLPALIMAGTDLRSARLVRLLQLGRILKLARLAHAFDRLVEALSAIRDQLLIFVILTMIVLFLASVGIYHFEHRAQPDVFKSVPHAMWWSVATLSTVGYGDIYPVTAGGRFFTGLVLLVGLAVIAVPTGLLSAALTANSGSPQTNRKGNENENNT